ncbi:MAG: winged helix-turn-helix domain-containing protein [Candidatus Thermoplasmatota archaeon]|nr:winged helix-turn-helix domain-containing protein [Candidatus Thermoplasmatota archaeon]
MENKYEKLNRIYSNPTNLMIIYLLLENESLTVTDMSKNLNMTRANLYRTVKNLVDENILLEGKTVVEKNYVKKYYSLNLEFFSSIKAAEQLDYIEKLDSEPFAEMLSSFFTSQSAFLNLQAQKINSMGRESRKQLKEKLTGDNFLFSFSSLENASFEKYLKRMKEVVAQMEKEDDELNQRDMKIGDNILLILAMPVIRMGDIGK